MNPADLKRLVRIGEGYHLEFKRKVSSPIRIAREAIALANTWGGSILIGVDDDGSIVGVKDAEASRQILKSTFNPKLNWKSKCPTWTSVSTRLQPRRSR